MTFGKWRTDVTLQCDDLRSGERRLRQCTDRSGSVLSFYLENIIEWTEKSDLPCEKKMLNRKLGASVVRQRNPRERRGILED